MLKTNQTLLVTITEYTTCEENDVIRFDHTTITDLQDFIPYHDEVDLDSRLYIPEPLHSTTLLHEEIWSDPFIVVDKCFLSRCNQYEFLATWVGYTDQTWELAGNIPEANFRSMRSVHVSNWRS